MKPAHKSSISFGLLFLCVLLAASCGQKAEHSANKGTVAEYIAGFNAGDHQKILACLTDDIVWEMPGFYRHEGKAAFDKEIENDAFTGLPVIKITRMTAEANVVIAEGSVTGKQKNGTPFTAVFCDVFEMNKGKIRKLTSYLMFKK